MSRRFQVCQRWAGTLLCCLSAFFSPVWASNSGVQVWHEPRSISALIDQLEDWLDLNSNYTRRTNSPVIKWIASNQLHELPGQGASMFRGKRRGVYDEDTSTIWLVQPWHLRDVHDASVLLHELVHHRQAGIGYWYCPGAKELPAYKLQQAWLRSFGIEPKVNWVAVVLESGCSPRDIHPR